MAELVYSREQLLTDHPYARPHEEIGYALHGGYLEDGSYHSPKCLFREPAVNAWQEQLTARDWPLIDASQEMLKRATFPNLDQMVLLLKHGMGAPFWNGLTITGVTEARGKALCEFDPPNWQDVIVEDISETCTGHLHKGLMYAHGADEGGDPDIPEKGAHDAMWFAARDMVFGKAAYPIPEVPDIVSRPQEGPLFPMLPETNSGVLAILMNVLMIELRTEAFFAFCCSMFRHPETFLDVKDKAELAAKIVERIRIDEGIHVGYLVTTISEMRSFTFKLNDGSTKAGHEIIDPIWASLVEWHGVTVFEESEKRSYEDLKSKILAHENGEALLAEFDKLATN